MKIQITITDEKENSTDEFEFASVQAQELYLILETVRISHNDNNIRLAKIIGGLISIGIDAGMKQFFTSQFKTMQRNFVETLGLEKT